MHTKILHTQSNFTYCGKPINKTKTQLAVVGEARFYKLRLEVLKEIPIELSRLRNPLGKHPSNYMHNISTSNTRLIYGQQNATSKNIKDVKLPLFSIPLSL